MNSVARLRRACHIGTDGGLSFAVLYLCADRSKYPQTEDRLRQMLRKHSGKPNIFLVIDNWNEDMPPTGSHDEIVIGGDNHLWEFSGWRKGIQWLKESSHSPEVCLFVNDAFLNYAHRGLDYLYYGAAFNHAGLQRARSSARGVRSTGHPNCAISGTRVDEWVKSNIFALPWPVAQRLEWCYVDDAAAARIFPASFRGNLFLPDAPLTAELRQFLRDWITNKWQFRRTIDPSNWNFIRSKLTAILNERLLSAELRSLDCPFDFLGRPKWLRGCVGTHAGASNQPMTPAFVSRRELH